MSNPTDTSAPAAPAPQVTETILVAEDSAPNRKILTHLLQKLGYDVIACENGQIAWETLSKPETPELAAVISDIMMPAMDGLGLLKEIRDSERWKNTRVLLITAVSDREYIARAKALKVDGYILKPVTFQKVSDRLKQLFPLREFPKVAA